MYPSRVVHLPFSCGRCTLLVWSMYPSRVVNDNGNGNMQMCADQSGMVAWAVGSFSLSRATASQIFDNALHPADISLDWVECDTIYDCFGVVALLQPVITCEGEMSNTLCGEHFIRKNRNVVLSGRVPQETGRRPRHLDYYRSILRDMDPVYFTARGHVKRSITL